MTSPRISTNCYIRSIIGKSYNAAAFKYAGRDLIPFTGRAGLLGSGRATLMLALLACFTAVAIFPLGASGQTACRVLDPELAGIYQGGCKDGLAEGYGEAKGQAEYRGDFHAGRKHGKGVKTWTSRDRYEGEFAEDRKQGKGVKTWPSGDRYEGEFAEDRKQGKGVKTWPSGDRYEGEFVEDRKQGTGRYNWGASGPSAGESYTGAYVDDLRHGYGVYEWPSGDRYAGPWANDAITGLPTPKMVARARAKAEALAAVAKPGVKVCRALLVGIAVRDWIRGEVTAVEADMIAVRIDDPGRQPHVIDNQPLVKGMTVRSAAEEWTPCT
jgi:hypothetical protein